MAGLPVVYPYPHYQPILVGDVSLPDLQDMLALRTLRARILQHDTFFRWLLKKSPILDHFLSSVWDWKDIDQDLIFESRPAVMSNLSKSLSIAREFATFYGIPVPYE